MIPIHLLTANGPLPAPPVDGNGANSGHNGANGISYLIAKNGIFKQVNNPFYTARVKVDGIGHLAEAKENAELCVPKLPLAQFKQIEAFFTAVYEAFKSEAVVVLLFNPATRQWRIEVPKQKVQDGSLHVAYEPTSVIPSEGFEPFGTIHSHAAAPAFHSGTDDSDEVCSDGLHITIGNLDKPVRSYAARWMLCGHAYTAQLEGVVESPALPLPDPAWMEKISHDIESTIPPFFHDDPRLDMTAPDLFDDRDIPPELGPEYDEFMQDAHERFKNRMASHKTGQDIRRQAC